MAEATVLLRWGLNFGQLLRRVYQHGWMGTAQKADFDHLPKAINSGRVFGDDAAVSHVKLAPMHKTCFEWLGCFFPSVRPNDS